MGRFERGLRAGVVITVSVTRKGYVGKRTTFVIRRGAAPLRVGSLLCRPRAASRSVRRAYDRPSDRRHPAAVAAAVFLAAFSRRRRAAPDTAAPADETTSASPAPRATQELKLATIAAPSLSRVAALPGAAPACAPQAGEEAPRRSPRRRSRVAPQATPVAPVATRAPAYTPPARRHAPPKRSSSGKTFDTSG